MSRIEPLNARELAEALEGYGDMPVRVQIVDAQDNQISPLYLEGIRLEINVGKDGDRWLAIVGYEGTRS